MSRKRHWEWQDDFDNAVKICAPFDVKVERSHHAYEIATIKGPGINLIIYPHTVSGTGNQHARTRDASSKDRIAASIVALALFQGIGLPNPTRTHFACTFSMKNKQLYHFTNKDALY